MLAYQLLRVVFKSMQIEATTAETIPKSKLIARPPSTACPAPAQWCFDHGIAIKSGRTRAGEKQEIPKMIALTRAHISERFLILAFSIVFNPKE
jgi:hypothetical protein